MKIYSNAFIYLGFACLLLSCSSDALVPPAETAFNQADVTVQELETEQSYALEQISHPQLDRPVDAQIYNNYLYVIEQHSGLIKRAPQDDLSQLQIFADFSALFGSTGNERGFLSFTFFNENTNDYLFIYGTDPNGESILWRYTLLTDNSGINADSALLILSFSQPDHNHNGGCIRIGPDNYLYLSTGDGGGANDEFNQAQQVNTLLGKLLRIDIRGADADNPYRIPADNPFIDNPEARHEIFAYGLRNPWRFCFDQNNDIILADVGQNTMEEINKVSSGANLGWPQQEGLFGSNSTAFNKPLFAYETNRGRCVIGGEISLNPSLPEIFGSYLFADFSSGTIWSLKELSSTEFELRELLRTNENLVSFCRQQNGELILLNFDGYLYRIIEKSPPEDLHSSQ